MALNKFCQQNLLSYYIGFLSEKGWGELKEILRSLHARNYICKRIETESKEIMSHL